VPVLSSAERCPGALIQACLWLRIVRRELPADDAAQLGVQDGGKNTTPPSKRKAPHDDKRFF